MNLFKLMATIGLDSKEYEKGITKAKGSTNNLAGLITKLGIGAMVGKIGKASVAMGMDFEASMSQVAATMGITKNEIKKGSKSFDMLEKAAKDAGSTTQFSATQSAEALNYLALAGYDAETSVKMLPKVLNLAAAGGMELASASDMVTDSMSALGIETKDADKFIDQMAKTSQKSNTNVSQLGDAILTVGGTAKVLKGGTVELNAQLGILADNGIKGAEGGTALRNMILSLSSPTDKAAGLMKKLGIEVFDANGNMRATNEIFSDLNKALGTMTSEKRTDVLSNLFNKVDLKSANALLANSGQRFNELSNNIKNSDGAAADMAETMNSNLAGAITTMKSSLEGAGISIYEKFKEPLTNAVNKATELIQNLTKVVDILFKDMETNGNNAIDSLYNGMITVFGQETADKVDLVAKAVFALANAFLFLKGVMIINTISTVVSGFINMIVPVFQAAKMVKSFAGAMAILNFVMGANPIGLVIKGISLLIAGFSYLWVTSSDFRDFWKNMWQTIKDLTKAAVDGIVKFFTETLPEGIASVGEWFFYLKEDIKKAFSEAGQAISQWWADTKKWFADGIDYVVNSVKQWWSDLKQEFFNSIKETKESIVKWWKDLGTQFRNGVKNITDRFSNMGESLKKSMYNFTTGISRRIGEIKDFFIDLSENGRKYFADFINESLYALGKIIGLAIGSVVKGVTGFFTYLGKILGGIVGLIVKTVTDSFNAFSDFVKKTISESVKFLKELPANIMKFFSDVIDYAKEWASEFFKNMIDTIVRIQFEWANKLAEIKQGIKDKFFEIVNSVKQWGIDMFNSAVQAGRDFKEAITTWFRETVDKAIKWKNDMVAKAKELGAEFVAATKAWIRNLPHEIKKWFDETVRKAIEFKDKMIAKAKEIGYEFKEWLLESLRNLPSLMAEVGRNIVDGVKRGIANAANNFKTYVKSFFSGIVDGAKESLGIHSPSRVFRDEVGKWIPQGVQVGIEGEMPDLKRSLQSNMNELTDIQISPMSLSSNNSNEQIIRLLTIIAEKSSDITLDGRELMRGLAPYQQEFKEYNNFVLI